MAEGGAEYVASIVTGSSRTSPKIDFGAAHEAEIWRQFVKDRAIANGNFDPSKGGFGGAGREAFGHWLYNGGGGALPGWTSDMGYWLGMQISKAYVERSTDPHAAIRELLALQDPAEILRKSHYADKFTER
ncbi:MAG: hypothetical protein HOP95_04400 [Sphingomonas sp.]|nr:hypothetical protein [Sphingomonas sp.]